VFNFIKVFQLNQTDFNTYKLKKAVVTISHTSKYLHLDFTFQNQARQRQQASQNCHAPMYKSLNLNASLSAAKYSKVMLDTLVRYANGNARLNLNLRHSS
jgi:hypothetical protein